MTLLFFILIVVVCALVAGVVLIQNPKGGGLSGSLSGLNTQFMSVKQTTDTLEKGTWIFISALVVLCLVSTLFLSGASTSGTDMKPLNDLNTSTAPASTAPANSNANQTAPMTAPVDSQKK